MTAILNRYLLQRLARWSMHYSRRNKSLGLEYNFDDEITENRYANVLILGINLPDEQNLLSDSALIKLNEKLKDFHTNDEYSIAVLHGVGGNFCTGIQKTANRDNAEEVLKTVNKLKKPTVASITGFTNFFGFQLAIMCDFRIMEVSAVFGLGHKKEKDQVFPIVCERLVSLTGVSATLDAVLTGAPLNYNDAYALGFINRWVECGTALGKSVNFAKSIAKYPLEDIIKERNLILSFASKRRFEPV